MKAVEVAEFGPTENLKVHSLDISAPGKGEVLVKVSYAGINPVDAKIRSGKHVSSKSLSLPYIPGKELTGEVVARGEDVAEFSVGEQVFGFSPSAYAEYAIVPVSTLLRMPVGISAEQAAAAPLAGLTAYQAIHEHLKLQPGERVLIQSAAGGVGHIAVQIARDLGVYIYGTASGRNLDFLRSIGVDRPINYQEERFEDVVRDVDCVLESMGGEDLYRAIRAVKSGGRVVCLPSFSRDDPKALDLAKERAVELIWFMVEFRRDDLGRLSDLLQTGKVKVHIDRVFGFADIVAAHKRMESHSVRGKIVLKPV